MAGQWVLSPLAHPSLSGLLLLLLCCCCSAAVVPTAVTVPVPTVVFSLGCLLHAGDG